MYQDPEHQSTAWHRSEHSRASRFLVLAAIACLHSRVEVPMLKRLKDKNGGRHLQICLIR